MKRPTCIWIKTQFIAFHCWPSAPQEVGYLRDMHRHVFGVRVRVFVGHSDRDVEFHLLKQFVDGIIRNGLIPRLNEIQSMSCEMMAEYIGDVLRVNKFSCTAVQVDEDGECGAEVYFPEKL